MRINIFMNHLDKVPICEHGLAQGYCSKCDNHLMTGINYRILEVMSERVYPTPANDTSPGEM